LIFTTENSFGGGDHFTHFKIARWSWKYPQLLYNHWGKPLFTILISPFAQLGINYARVFNLIAGLLTAWFSYKLSETLKFKNASLTILLVVLTPIYFSLMFSVMTEVLHSLFLVLAIWLFFKNRYAWSAVAISFLPIIRTESITLIPVFLLALGLRKQWKTIPLMLAGFLIISLAGWHFYKGFWWLITEIPYKGSASGIYGHGNLLHFVKSTKGILGFPIAGLFVIGLLTAGWLWVKNDHLKLNDRFYFLLLIPGIYLIFLAAHSIVWWKGWGNSLGLIRVIGSVAPLAAVTALAGFNFLEDIYGKYNRAFKAFVAMLLLWIVTMAFSVCREGFKKSDPQKVLTDVTNYIIANHLDNHKIYYFNNYIPFRLNIDPYDGRRSAWGVPDAIKISYCIPDSSIIVWDAHFGPNEGRTSLQKLLNDNNLKLIKKFEPEKPFTVLGGYSYKVFVFQKIGSEQNNNVLLLNFEQDNPEYSDERAFTGKKSFKVEKNKLFLNLMVNKVVNLCPGSCKLIISGAIYINEPLLKKDVLLAISRSSEQSPYFFKAFDLSEVSKPKQWAMFKYEVRLKPPANKNEIIKAFFWNKKHKEFWVDNIEVKVVKSGNGY